ncbi:hypothetical protein BGZ95_007910 [Linnemannia exigua]|uniref:Rho-GAP domain-containing protein n=1 Tax=Linnemannia exigua TaxID=604196 RepID=A0AAD4H805_9FUNG|nr:hypothetical protein BGZ95_007910 [Linnemannia exigua]
MFRLVNKRLAANRELQHLKQEFNQCSLPIEFVYRIVVSCVDEIMERGLNHPFILKNPYSPSVVGAMVTLMADPERRDLFSLKCTRIDTVAGVMLAVLKNLREAIVPMEIQEALTSANGAFSNATSGASTPTTTTRIQYRINTVNALLSHPNFPAVNRALLIELLNLSLAILNRSSFNRVKPDMLASILGPHIFASQHATILQHTPQQTYSFGWGIALVNDIKRCSKMFYVLLGGYRREVLGPDEWEFENGLNSASGSAYNVPFANAAPLSAPSTGAPLHQWPGSTSTIHGGGILSAGMDMGDSRSFWFGQNSQRRLHQSVPHLRIVTDSNDSPGGPRSAMSRSSMSRYGMVRNVSTALTESIRAAAAEEAKSWNLERSNSGSKGPAALEHLRNNQQQHSRSHISRGGGSAWNGRQGRQSVQSIEQRHQELFDQQYRGRVEDNAADELSQAFRRHNLHHQAEVESENIVLGDDLSRQREEKRLAIEQMIRECRGTGLNFAPKENELELEESPTQDHGRNTRQYDTLAFY